MMEIYVYNERREWMRCVDVIAMSANNQLDANVNIAGLHCVRRNLIIYLVYCDSVYSSARTIIFMNWTQNMEISI